MICLEKFCPKLGAEIYEISLEHIKVIVDKCKGDLGKALFFVDEVKKTIGPELYC